MRKVITVLVLAGALHAEDAKPLATVEELTKQVAEQQKEIELLRADNAWLDKDRQIAYAQGNFRFDSCMGQRPSQAQQRQMQHLPVEKK